MAFFVKGETFTTTLEEQRWEAPPLPPYTDAAVALAKAPAVGGGGADDRLGATLVSLEAE